MANDFGTSRLFWGKPDGPLVDGTHAAGLGTDENGMGLTVADYNGDGRLDVFVTSIFTPIRCARTACADTARAAIGCTATTATAISPT